MKLGKFYRGMVWGAAMAALGVSLGADALSYTVTDLGTLGGGWSTANGLNDAGHVVGNSRTASGELRAFLYDGASIHDLGTLGGNHSLGYGINNNGEIVGYSWPSTGAPQAFLFDGASMSDIGSPAGYSYGYGLNDLGQVVGESGNANGHAHAFLYSDNQMIDLGTLGGDTSYASAVNNLGHTVGGSRLHPSSNTSHAFLYDGSNMVDLGALGHYENNSYATGINDHGQVVGKSETMSGDQHAFLHDGTSMIDLGTLGGSASYATGINEAGQIVGSSAIAVGGTYHAFLYDTSLGGMLNLNDYIGPSSGWTLADATGINDRGQIVGRGYLNGESRAFLLTPNTPIPEPATLSLLGMGLAGLAIRSRRLGARH